MSSWFWMGVIVLGGALVVIGNIQYARTKGAEDSQKLASVARTVLRSEIERNRGIASNWRRMLNDESGVPIERFETSGWEAISGGQMLSALSVQELQTYTETYEKLTLANSIQSQMLDFVHGPGGELSVVRQQLQAYRQNADAILTILERLFDEIPGPDGKDGPD